jgi:hypothetical protein
MAGEDGRARPVLRIDRRAGWLGWGRTPVTTPPERAWGRPTFAEPRRGAGGELVEDPVVTTDDERLPAILGDDVFVAVDRTALGEAARSGLPLAERILAGPVNAAGVIATESPRHVGGGRASAASSGNRFGRAVQVDSHAYLPLASGTVVPLSRRTVSTSRVLLPRQEHVLLAAGGVLAVLLVRGAWLARRFRPVPTGRHAAATTGDA